MTKEDKPIAIILPNWNPNEPRFIVEDAHDELADDRAFKNGKCVYNQRLDKQGMVMFLWLAVNDGFMLTSILLRKARRLAVTVFVIRTRISVWLILVVTRISE